MDNIDTHPVGTLVVHPVFDEKIFASSIVVVFIGRSATVLSLTVMKTQEESPEWFNLSRELCSHHRARINCFNVFRGLQLNVQYRILPEWPNSVPLFTERETNNKADDWIT